MADTPLELPQAVLEACSYLPLLMNLNDWTWHKRKIEADNKCEFQHGPGQPSQFPCRVRSTPTDTVACALTAFNPPP
jgi:hypothetical protein